MYLQCQRLDKDARALTQLPRAAMPLAEDTQSNINAHPRLVTSLTGFQSHFYDTGLTPHPSRKAAYWGIQPRATSNVVLQFKPLRDTESYEKLKKLEAIECGLYTPL